MHSILIYSNAIINFAGSGPKCTISGWTLSNSVWEYIKGEKWDKAEDACKRLLKEYPDQIDGLHRSAELWEARGNTGKAAEYYKKAADFAKEAEGFDQSTIDSFTQKAEQLAK